MAGTAYAKIVKGCIAERIFQRSKDSHAGERKMLVLNGLASPLRKEFWKVTKCRDACSKLTRELGDRYISKHFLRKFLR